MAISIDGTNGLTTDNAALKLDGTTLAVDDTNNRVGIGTTSPSETLSVFAGADGVVARFTGASSSRGLLIKSENGLQASNLNTIDSRSSGSEGILGFATDGTERMRIDASGNLKFNSGYGSVATAYGCRAWVQFNGTGSVAIRGSGNVTSVTDQGVGKYDVNYTTSIVDDTYSCQVTKKNEAANSGFVIQVPDLLTTRTRVECFENNTLTDSGRVSVAVFR